MSGHVLPRNGAVRAACLVAVMKMVAMMVFQGLWA